VRKSWIGAFVVGAIALLVLAIAIFGPGKFLEKRPVVVMLFQGSVKGLNTGSPLLFRGVPIGSVKEINIVADPQKLSIQIPVYAEFDPERIKTTTELRPEPLKNLNRLIQAGLRAELEAQSLVTGQLLINLDFFPDTTPVLVGADPRYPEVPTKPTELHEFLKKLEALPIDELVRNLNDTVVGLNTLVSSPELTATVRNPSEFTKELKPFLANLDREVARLASSLDQTVKEFGQVARDADTMINDADRLVKNVDKEVPPSRPASRRRWRMSRRRWTRPARPWWRPRISWLTTGRWDTSSPILCRRSPARPAPSGSSPTPFAESLTPSSGGAARQEDAEMARSVIRPVLLLGAVCLLLVWGCAGSPAIRYYTLSALAKPGAGAQQVPASESLAILVGPIRFPPYLDWSGIVTRTNSNAIEIAEFDVWAGALSDEFPRVLADNLSALLATDRVSTFPRLMGYPVDYQVTGDVVQFDGSPNGQATLIARWNLVRAGERKLLASRQSTISVPVGAPGYQALVAAQSRAVEQLGREIADALKSLPR
jgi:paraquat-inducible protein B